MALRRVAKRCPHRPFTLGEPNRASPQALSQQFARRLIEGWIPLMLSALVYA